MFSPIDIHKNKLISLYINFFLDIISDLFPGLIEIPMDYGVLEAGIHRSIKQMGLEDVNGESNFLLINLYLICAYVFEYIILFQHTITSM